MKSLVVNDDIGNGDVDGVSVAPLQACPPGRFGGRASIFGSVTGAALSPTRAMAMKMVSVSRNPGRLIQHKVCVPLSSAYTLQYHQHPSLHHQVRELKELGKKMKVTGARDRSSVFATSSNFLPVAAEDEESGSGATDAASATKEKQIVRFFVSPDAHLTTIAQVSGTAQLETAKRTRVPRAFYVGGVIERFVAAPFPTSKH